MDGQMSSAKLARTQSAPPLVADVEAQKKRSHNAQGPGPVLLASLLSLLTLLFLLRVSPEFLPSENLLLILIFMAVALFLANRSKTPIHRRWRWWRGVLGLSSRGIATRISL